MKKYIALIFSAALCVKVNSQLSTSQMLGQLNTITTAVPFLIISPDSRAGGMGDAGCATSPDVWSTHWNPAKLAFAGNKMGAGVSYTPWLRALVPDINMAYISFYHKLKFHGAIGSSLRYFSMGEIQYINIVGGGLGQFRPFEFAYDICYAHKLNDNFSLALSARYIYSNLTNGISINGASSRPGTSIAADLSAFYHKAIFLFKKQQIWNLGINISNVGNKIGYTWNGARDFTPINLRIGQSIDLTLDDHNTIAFCFDLNKLLVPTPPVYQINPATGQPATGPNGQYIIVAGNNPNVSVLQGMLQSFTDAPGGWREELKEVIICGGMEYWYGQPRLFCFRTGYFHEAATKGGRKYFTFGIGVKYKVFGLDLSYIVPAMQRNPLENTLRFSLMFDFFKLPTKEIFPEYPLG